MAGEFVYVSPEEKAKKNQEEVEYFRQAQGAPRTEMEAYLARERGMANTIYDQLASGRLSVAQQQMQAGLAGTQQALAGQAAAGGANPLAARAATYAGGQAGVDVSRQTAALRAQEMQAARQMQMGALQRGTEGILAQQQMDMQAAQSAAQKEAAAKAQQLQEEQASWQKTKDIAGMASFGLVSDPKTKNVYGSDRELKTMAGYTPSVRPTEFGAGKAVAAAGQASAPTMDDIIRRTVIVPQGGGLFAIAAPTAQQVMIPPAAAVEGGLAKSGAVVYAPNPAYSYGDPTLPEELMVTPKKPGKPKITDYMQAGAYGPAQTGKGPAKKKPAPKGKAPAKGATKGAMYSGPIPSMALIEKMPLEEQEKWLSRMGYQRPVYEPAETKDIYSQGVASPKIQGRKARDEAFERENDLLFNQRVQFDRAQQAGLVSPARVTRVQELGQSGETWEQMAKRIYEQQRQEYFRQGGPGL